MTEEAVGNSQPRLFTPLRLRGVQLANRIVIAPMFQAAGDREGRVTDWHLVHLGHLSIARPAMVLTEVCAVEPRGRNTYADIGLWDDAHIDGLRKITDFISAQGVIPAVQIGHGGRKASSRRPWDGKMRALDAEDEARGEP